MTDNKASLIWEAAESYFEYKKISASEITWCTDDVKNEILWIIKKLNTLDGNKILNTDWDSLNFTQKRLLIYIDRITELFLNIKPELNEEKYSFHSKKLIKILNSQIFWEYFKNFNDEKLYEYFLVLYDNCEQDLSIVSRFLREDALALFYLTSENIQDLLKILKKESEK